MKAEIVRVLNSSVKPPELDCHHRLHWAGKDGDQRAFGRANCVGARRYGECHQVEEVPSGVATLRFKSHAGRVPATLWRMSTMPVPIKVWALFVSTHLETGHPAVSSYPTRGRLRRGQDHCSLMRHRGLYWPLNVYPRCISAIRLSSFSSSPRSTSPAMPTKRSLSSSIFAMRRLSMAEQSRRRQSSW